MDLDDVVTPTELIARVREAAAAVRAGEAELLVLAAAWADAHPDLDAEPSEATDDDLDPDGPDPRVPALAWQASAATTGSRPTPAGATTPSRPAPGDGPTPAANNSSATTKAPPTSPPTHHPADNPTPAAAVVDLS
jgi:hypothetical protein